MKNVFPKNPDIVNGSFYFIWEGPGKFNTKLYIDFVNQDEELANRISFRRQKDGSIHVQVMYGLTDEAKKIFYNNFLDKLDEYIANNDGISRPKAIQTRTSSTILWTPKSLTAQSPALNADVLHQNTHSNSNCNDEVSQINTNLNNFENRKNSLADPFSINIYSDSSDSASDPELDELEKEITSEMKRMSLDLIKSDQDDISLDMRRLSLDLDLDPSDVYIASSNSNITNNKQLENINYSWNAGFTHAEDESVSESEYNSETDSGSNSDVEFIKQLEIELEKPNVQDDANSAKEKTTLIPYNLFFTLDIEIKENKIIVLSDDPAIIRGLRKGLKEIINDLKYIDPEFNQVKINHNVKKGKLVLTLPENAVNFYQEEFLPLIKDKKFKCIQEENKAYTASELCDRFDENTPVINNQITLDCKDKFEVRALDIWLRNKRSAIAARDKLEGKTSLFSLINLERNAKLLKYVITFPDIEDFYRKEFLPVLRSKKKTGQESRRPDTKKNTRKKLENKQSSVKQKSKEDHADEFALTRIHDHKNIFVEREVAEDGVLYFDCDQPCQLCRLVDRKIKKKELQDLVTCRANETGKLTLIIKTGVTSEEKTEFYNKIFRQKIIPKKHFKHVDFTKWLSEDSKLTNNYILIKCDNIDEQNTVSLSLSRKIREKLDIQVGLVKVFELDGNEIVVKFNHKDKEEAQKFFSEKFLPVVCRIGCKLRSLDYSLLKQCELETSNNSLGELDPSKTRLVVDVKSRYDARTFRTACHVLIRKNDLKMKVEQRVNHLEFTIDAENKKDYYETFFLPLVENIGKKRKRNDLDSSVNLDPQNNDNNQDKEQEDKFEESVEIPHKRNFSEATALQTFGAFKTADASIACDAGKNLATQNKTNTAGPEHEEALDLF